MMDPTPYKTFDGKVTIKGTVYVEIPDIPWEEWSDMETPTAERILEDLIAEALSAYLGTMQHHFTVEASNAEVIKQ